MQTVLPFICKSFSYAHYSLYKKTNKNCIKTNSAAALLSLTYQLTKHICKIGCFMAYGFYRILAELLQLSLKKHSETSFRIRIFLCPYVPGASHFSLSLPSVPRDFREASRRRLALDPIGLSPLGHLMRFTQFNVRYCFFTTR